MRNRTARYWYWLGIGALLALLGGVLSPRALAAPAPPDRRLSTRYFTIVYPAGEEQTANWYAGFADDTDAAVSDLLGTAPIAGLTLHIYASEADYQAANPVASFHPDILAHAIPERKEIGVAVGRLRAEAPDLARVSFRHEMTHILAGALTRQHLNASFQEGLAQYDELSDDRAAGVVRVMQQAQAAGVSPLPWSVLDDDQQFRAHLDLAYPESYTVMAFLADRYGMGAFARFLARIGAGQAIPDALQAAYGAPAPALEAQWRAYLPGFYQDGWKTNVLRAYDLGPARALYESGQYAAARDAFARSAQLYRDLGRMARVAEAETGETQAAQATDAATTLDQARQALTGHDYGAAAQAATGAQASFQTLGRSADAGRAAATLALAQQGQGALAALAAAQEHTGLLDGDAAVAPAQGAATAFAALGDAAHLDTANAILAAHWSTQRSAGLGALAVGLLLALGGAGAAMRARRRRPGPAAQEESPSWL